MVGIRAAKRVFTKLAIDRGMLKPEAERQVAALGRDIPGSVPDAEEVMRRQRRKFFAQQRRRSGRMSTILTGGESSGGMGLG